MIVDCFIFFNEIALLNMRLKELYSVIDLFVVVEAGETFSGQKKPFYIDLYKDQIEDPDDKLIYIKLPALPPIAGNGEKERFWLESYHRNAVMQGLLQCNLKHEDYVLLSDIDEIPSASSVSEFIENCGDDDIWQFSQLFLKGYFDEDMDDGYNRRFWGGTVGVRYSVFGKTMPQELRREVAVSGQIINYALARNRDVRILEKAGWHLSSFGGALSREYKLSHYAHGIMNKAILDDHGVRVQLGSHSDLSMNSTSEINEFIGALEAELQYNLPKDVRENALKYSRFFKEYDK